MLFFKLSFISIFSSCMLVVQSLSRPPPEVCKRKKLRTQASGAISHINVKSFYDKTLHCCNPLTFLILDRPLPSCPKSPEFIYSSAKNPAIVFMCFSCCSNCLFNAIIQQALCSRKIQIKSLLKPFRHFSKHDRQHAKHYDDQQMHRCKRRGFEDHLKCRDIDDEHQKRYGHQDAHV